VLVAGDGLEELAVRLEEADRQEERLGRSVAQDVDVTGATSATRDVEILTTRS